MNLGLWLYTHRFDGPKNTISESADRMIEKKRQVLLLHLIQRLTIWAGIWQLDFKLFFQAIDSVGR